MGAAAKSYNIKEAISTTVEDLIIEYNAFSSIHKHKIINNGISSSVFVKILSNTLLTDSEWAKLLHIDKRTFNRYKSENKVFKPIYSDRILEIVDAILLGLEVFDSEELFYEWFYRKSFSLGNQSPFQLLGTSYGKQLVMDELYRIEHGIFS